MNKCRVCGGEWLAMHKCPGPAEMSTKPMGENEAWYRNLTRQNAAEMSTKPETAERAELIRKLNSYAHAIERFGNTNVSQAVKEAAALLADGKAAGEVVHQWRKRTEKYWYDDTKEQAYLRVDEHYEARTLYTRPQPAAQVAQPLTVWEVRSKVFQMLFTTRDAAIAWQNAAGMATPSMFIQPIEVMVFADSDIGKDQTS